MGTWAGIKSPTVPCFGTSGIGAIFAIDSKLTRNQRTGRCQLIFRRACVCLTLHEPDTSYDRSLDWPAFEGLPPPWGLSGQWEELEERRFLIQKKKNVYCYSNCCIILAPITVTRRKKKLCSSSKKIL